MKKVPDHLSWVEKFVKSSKSFRLKLVRTLLSGIKKYETKNDKDFGKKLYEELTSGKFELVGVVPMVQYINVDDPNKNNEVIYQHAHGVPAMLFHLKGTNVMLLTSPSLRVNTSIVHEREENELNDDVIGISS